MLAHGPEQGYAVVVPASAGAICRRQTICGLLAVVAEFIAPARASATPPVIGKPRGRPKIIIERTSFATGIADAAFYTKHLKDVLRREARRADWGAGAGSTIRLRFMVETLTLSEQQGVLHVRCSALGELPKHRTARSLLKYGGDAREGRQLVFRVLSIVARGVVTRLSDLERARRSIVS